MTDLDTDFTATSELLDEEAALGLPTVDELICCKIGQYIADRSVREALTVTAAVFLGDRIVYKVALPGTTDQNDVVVEAKRRTALLNGHSSLYERNQRLEGGTTFEDETGLKFPEYAPFGGAVPLKSEDGSLAGFVIVSGLTQEEDHSLAVDAIKAALAGS